MLNEDASWKGRLLLQPLNTLSPRTRLFVVAVGTVLVAIWCWFFNPSLRYAWTLPDVMYYVRMAKGRFDLVPAPFSARPLAPLIARAVSSLAHSSVEGGLLFLAVVSLLFTVASVLWLATETRAPRAMLLVLAAVPFWPQLLDNAGLPDPLSTALLAAFLLALNRERLYLAATLLLPMMITRESTWLVVLCLLAITPGARRWRVGLAAVVCAAAGALVVRRLSAGSLPNPEHLSGGVYMAGKLMANTARSLGFTPWSNVYPALCAAPTWQTSLRLGPVHSVGVCEFRLRTPMEAMASAFTVFGMLPVLCLMLAAARCLPLRRTSLLTRFCLVYGGISFLLAPSLGTWYVRLFGYGWPLFLVALPRLLPGTVQGLAITSSWTSNRAFVWGAVVGVHLVVFALGQTPQSFLVLACMFALEIASAALLVVHLRGSREASFPG